MAMELLERAKRWVIGETLEPDSIAAFLSEVGTADLSIRVSPSSEGWRANVAIPLTGYSGLSEVHIWASKIYDRHVKSGNLVISEREFLSVSVHVDSQALRGDFENCCPATLRAALFTAIDIARDNVPRLPGVPAN